MKEGYRVKFLRNKKGKTPSSGQGLSLITSSSIFYYKRKGNDADVSGITDLMRKSKLSLV